jgi:hypothetical protein
MARREPPREVELINAEIRRFLLTEDENTGRSIGSARRGVYAFYDYDGEPIYVGQTVENISTRLGRHLTGRRSDAVAKFILDPFEVLEIEVWPMFDLEGFENREAKRFVDAAEYIVFQEALDSSEFQAVLNEGDIPEPQESVEMPTSYRGRIVPDELFEDRNHPDVRLARRAQTIASLARLISERSVGDEIRQTLLVQAKRLEYLAEQRLADDTH